MIKLFEAFAGYGSQALALKRLKIDFTTVGISEIDSYALTAYAALHETVPKNYGDISKIDWNEVEDFDLFTYSFPCQDISAIGTQLGLKEGSNTRSSLLWECKKAIEAKKPQYLLMENVKNLVSRKNKPEFDKWLAYLSSLGYTNYWKIVNAKDCGIPQNRERVFCVSILDDKDFTFIEPQEMKSLKELNIPVPIVHKGQYGSDRIYTSYSPTLTRATGGNHIPFVEDRKLTPYECGLLMGLTEEESDKLSNSGLSNTRLYNALGNSIVVDVLEGIFYELFKEKEVK